MKPEKFVEVMRLFKDPHDYLLLNVRKQKLYYKFEAEVMLNEDKDESE
jgi:hypothetical protein